ncbi:MAG: 6,7-dimethyl-8-ribityllumazine synthase [Gammaproteobacteria bacterium]|nr:MAG: 6,7-dimethyl-8-ribityllumazine synthase [Gammaproteobacteria bacterium]TDJ42117.1 MAG: 6,7-dimethyl-8-ribityllumazine synthase [Gammaproteobacteria bacterium]
MSDSKPKDVPLDGTGKQFAIVAGRFNSFVVDNLVTGAIETLKSHGVAVSDVALRYVPGCFELPLTAQRIAARGEVDAIIALGAVIRGDTPHFEYVAGESARGLQDVALKYDLPVVFGVLTTDNDEQALARADLDGDNKGVDAANAALEMVAVLAEIG